MKQYKLGDVCNIVSGGTPSRSNSLYWNGGTIPWIKIGNISKKYVDSADEFITQEGLDGSSAKMLPAGTILYTIFATLGEVGILKIDACTNQAIAGLTIKNPEQVRTDYIYYYLKSKKSYVSNIGRGVAQNNINMSMLRDFDIPLPTIEEQDEIVSVLERTASVIEARKTELDKLDELVKARFVEMFGNPVTNEKGWPSKFLSELTTKIGSGATPKGGKESYREEGITLIRSMNVHNGEFDYKDLAHISDEQAAKLDGVTIEPNDVLLNITGASVARSCVVPNEILPARVNQHVCIIRCKEHVIPEFLNKLLIDDNYQSLLWSIAGSGATREAITKQQVEELQIILPPITTQKEFVEFVKQVDKSKVEVQKALEETQLLFDSLMQEYFG